MPKGTTRLGRRGTTAELCEDIVRVAKTTGRFPAAPTQVTYDDDELRCSCVGTIKYRFGSWNEGMEAAGLSTRPQGRPRIQLTH